MIRLYALAVCVLVALGNGAVPSAWAAEPLRVGLLPFTNTLKLLRMYEPVKRHLEESLGREVILGTDPDYVTHMRSLHDGSYDMMITGPNFGADGILSGDFVPILRYNAELRPILVVRKDSSVTRPESLRGRKVALSSRLSVSTITGLHWLADHGLRADEDFSIVVSPTHTTAMMAVTLGEADGALTTYTPLHQLRADIRDQLRVLESPYAVPHLFVVAASSLPAGTRREIKDALLSFEASPQGRIFFAQTGYNGFVPLTDQDVVAVKSLVAETHRQVERMQP